MSLSRTRARIAAALLFLLTLVAATSLLGYVLPDAPWVQVPFHSVTEAVGVLAALLLAGLVLQLPANGAGIAGRRLWAACGLITVGVLDLFHASVAPGNLFVWLHSMSLLAGGSLFALAWLPVRVSRRRRLAFPLTAAVLTTAFAGLSVHFPQAIPSMIGVNGFSTAAMAINVAGGGLFLLAAVRFGISYEAGRASEDLMFATLALLFALSGTLFEYSRLWNADWWLWHMLRLVGYLLAALFVLYLFQRVQRTLAQTNAALEREIGERRHAQEQLLRKSQELQRTNAELEEFAYVASHDLKAPLRAVANLALVIDEEAAERLDPENRRLLRLVRERVMLMDTLIEGLLNFARLGRTQNPKTGVPLEILLPELIGQLPIPPGFHVRLVGPLPTLWADPVELRQIFQNLVTNAIAHHDRDEGQVWIRAHESGDSWCLEVSDDGPGIPVSERTQIFRMFSTRNKTTHTGIGLAVVRKLVLANDGEIEVTDRPPRGTVIRIVWPKHGTSRHADE